MRARFADVAENKNTGRPISAVTVDVFAQGTTTPISETIYVGPTGSDVLANPFTGGSDGEIEFWLAAPVAVDVRYTKTGFTTETKTVVANPPAIPLTDKGAANGVATLDGSGLVPGAQLPSLAINETFVVNSQAAMLALTAQRGDMAVRTDLAQTFVLTADAPTVLANWVALETPSGTTAAIAAEAALRTAADALLIPLAQRAAANGVATLDASSTVPDAQIPATIARDAETTAAVAAEATIRAAGDTAEAAARATAVSTEATLRAAGDAAEIAARTAAISALNGTYVARNGVLASVTRDSQGRVTGLTDDTVAETYTRDAQGRVATITVGATTRTVSRNASGQVTGVA